VPAEAWAEAIGVVREVTRLLGLEATVAADAAAPWHPGRCASLSIQGTGGEVGVGYAGELHPRVCRSFGLPERTAYAEVDVDVLVAAAPEVRPAPAFSTMPVAKADVALVVDAATPAGDVEAGSGRVPDRCWSRSGCSTSTPASRSRPAEVAGVRAAVPRPDRTLTDEEVAAAREAAVDGRGRAVRRHPARLTAPRGALATRGAHLSAAPPAPWHRPPRQAPPCRRSLDPG
jgi:phenylalanyl-tRNA synthetase beta chain